MNLNNELTSSWKFQIGCLFIAVLFLNIFEIGHAQDYGSAEYGDMMSHPGLNGASNTASLGSNTDKAFSNALSGAEKAKGEVAKEEKKEDLATMMAVMSALSMLQGMGSGSSAGQASDTGSNSFGGVNSDFGGGRIPSSTDFQNTNGTHGIKGNPGSGNILADIKAGKYKDAGIDSAGNVTLKGKPVDGNNPAGSFAAAGMSKGSIDSAMKTVDAIQKDIMKNMKVPTTAKSSGYDEGGGGSGGGSSGFSPPSSSSKYETDMGYGTPSATGHPTGIDPSQVAGLTKNLKGDPIGVSVDDIFVMMSRRYQAKENQNYFFGEGE